MHNNVYVFVWCISHLVKISGNIAISVSHEISDAADYFENISDATRQNVDGYVNIIVIVMGLIIGSIL